MSDKKRCGLAAFWKGTSHTLSSGVVNWRVFVLILRLHRGGRTTHSIQTCIVETKEESATFFPSQRFTEKKRKKSKGATIYILLRHNPEYKVTRQAVARAPTHRCPGVIFWEAKMKTRFINGVSSSPTLSLGLLVTENVLQVQPSTEEHCKELIRPDEPDPDTRRKAYLWCREFLHGSWKSLHESDFKITIIRYGLVKLK